MTFSNEWENCYAENTHQSVWPWSDVVSLVYRHCKKIILDRGSVYELGCGAGANIPFIRSLGLEYKGIDGSQFVVKQLHLRYPDMISNIVCGDFTIEQPFGKNCFDLIIDRASITHNNTKSINRALNVAFDSLKPGGTFIGVDWFSKNHSDVLFGKEVDDEYTRNNFNEGQFSGVGKVHFSDENHLRHLFQNFKIIYMEEKISRRHEPMDGHQFASWNIVVRKADA